MCLFGLILAGLMGTRAFGVGYTEAIGISGGEDHTLVVLQDGTVHACGDNDYWQLGLGGSEKNDEPLLKQVVDSAGTGYIENIAKVSAGWTHSLALDEDEYVWAWGNNGDGQLGNGTTTNSSKPVKVKGLDGVGYLSNIIDISAGRSGTHSLAVDGSGSGGDNGYAWSWGNNSYGQLGIGDEPSQNTPWMVLEGEMTWADTYLEGIIAVSAAEGHSMALDKDNYVWTFGNNAVGELGSPDTGNYSDLPVQVHAGYQNPVEPDSALSDIVAISGGWDHSMALQALDENDQSLNGNVYCWGEGADGRLGNCETYDQSRPVIVQKYVHPNYVALDNIVAISAGDKHSLALDSAGNVWSWGDDSYEQLGNGDSSSHRSYAGKVKGFRGVGFLSDIVAISAGYWHSIALDSDGVVWVWGKGDEGSLGLGRIIDRSTPWPVGIAYNEDGETYHSKLEEAIDDASSGDTIEIRGSFDEHFEIGSDSSPKSVTITGADPDNSGLVGKTILHYTPSDGWYIVKFIGSQNSSIIGATITGEDFDSADCYPVRFYNSSTISKCIVEKSRSQGIYCSSSTSPSITGCTVRENIRSGIYSDSASPTISNCLISGNGLSSASAYPPAEGGGIYCKSSSGMIVKSCTITGNEAEDCGAGMYIESSSPKIASCIFTGNEQTTGTAYSEGGGGLYNYQGSPNIANCVFWANTAKSRGGGILNYYQSSPTVTNCTFSDNTALYGGGIANRSNCDASVSNCIIWGNDQSSGSGSEEVYIYDDASDPTFTNCDIQGGWDGSRVGPQSATNGGGNINSDPDFFASGNYHLSSDSPCIDAGDDELVPDDVTDIDDDSNTGETLPWDIDEQDRIITTVEIGADETDYECECLGDLNGDDQRDLEDLQDLSGRLSAVGSPFIVYPWDAENWHPCGDMNEDDQMDLDDLQALSALLLEAGSPFIVPCEGERAGGGERRYEAPEPMELVKFLEMVRETNEGYRKIMTDAEWEIFIAAFEEHLLKKAETPE